eukprot:1004962-Pleurochrysis_carterae.AAC.11
MSASSFCVQVLERYINEKLVGSTPAAAGNAGVQVRPLYKSFLETVSADHHMALFYPISRASMHQGERHRLCCS